MAAQRRHRQIITRAAGEFAAVRAFLAVGTQLDLVFGVPAGIVADHDHHWNT